MKDLLTINEVADRLDVNRRTVERWIADGKLEAMRFGRLYRISLEDLERFGKRHEAAATT